MQITYRASRRIPPVDFLFVRVVMFQSMSRLIFISLRPTPWHSNQCNSAFDIVSSGRRTRPIAFSFRQRVPPYCLRNRGSARIALPTAMVSTCSSGPTSSKSITRYLVTTGSGRLPSARGRGSGGLMVTAPPRSVASPRSTRCAKARLSSYNASSMSASLTVRFCSPCT